MSKKFRILAAVLCMVMLSSVGVHAEERTDSGNVSLQNSEALYSEESVSAGDNYLAEVETQSVSSAEQEIAEEQLAAADQAESGVTSGPASVDQAETVDTSVTTEQPDSEGSTEETESSTQKDQSGQSDSDVQSSQSGQSGQSSYKVQSDQSELSVQSVEARDAAVKTEVTTDNAAGKFTVAISNLPASGVSKVEVAVWSSKGDHNGQDDLYWYTLQKQSDGRYVLNENLARHSYETGEYIFHVYATFSDGRFECIGTAKKVFSASSAGVKLTSTSTGYQASVSDIEIPGGVKSVRYAVWSDENGQDDLKWYTGSLDSSAKNSTVSYRLSDFNTYGKYYLDVYGVNAAGKSVYLGGTVYYVNPAKASSIDVVTDNAAGWFKVTVNGLPSSGISKVQVAIWSANGGQDDLVWYTAQKQSNGSYVVNKNLALHAYDTGEYIFHVYSTTTDGYFGCVGTAKTQFTVSKGTVSVSKTSTGYKAAVSGVSVPGGLKSVRYAVWSDEGWQDDLKWFTGSYSNGASGITYSNSEFGSYGKYYVDVYGTNVLGKSIYLGGTTYTVSGPSAKGVTVTTDNSAGKFTVTANGVVSDMGISKVQVGVWNEKDGQDDLTWYTLQKQSNGDYSVTANLSKHQYLTGKYNFHVYVTDLKGYKGCIGTGKAEYTSSSSGVSVKAATENVKYTMSVSDVVLPGGVQEVRFAVWSVKGGQDDLRWYTASRSGNTYSASFNISDHKTEGIYYVDAYAKSASGKLICLGGYYKTEVKLSVDASVSVTESADKEGTFNAYVTVNSASAPVSSVKVAVWSNNGWQDDLKWYTASKQSDGRYLCTFSADNHKYDVGKYYVDVYVVFSNTMQKYACGATPSFNPTNYLYVQKTANGKRDIVIKNVPSGTTKVEFAVWSNENGQDDLHWYTAAKQSDGSYKLSLNLSDFNDAGTFTVHTYRNGNRTNPYFLKATTFTADKSEIGTVGDALVKQYAQELIKLTGGDLEKVFWWIVNNYTYVHMETPQSYPDGYTRQQYYFVRGYQNRSGNCFNFAATFYWVAKELGYDCSLIEARCLYASGAHGAHSWVEVYIDGTTYICDPQITYQSRDYTTYMLTYASARLTYYRNEPAY